MKPILTTKFYFKKTSSFLMASLFLLGCGQVQTTDTRKDNPAQGANPREMNVLKDGASMELTVPPAPFASADSLELSLEQKIGNDALRLVHQARYSPTQTTIKIDQLAPGPYRIRLKLWDSKTKTIFAQGGGDTILQKNQTSKAQIVMKALPAETGSLEISIVYPDVKSPIVCTTEARLPSCIKFGTGYKVQTFSKNDQCEWVPKAVEVVDSKFCAGLPGAETLR